MRLWEKTEAIATKLYGASEIVAETNVRQRFGELHAGGFGKLEVEGLF